MLTCIQCSTRIPIAGGDGRYVTAYDPQTRRVHADNVLMIPLKIVWCGACNAPTNAEDLRPQSVWEEMFAMRRAGKDADFPRDTGSMSLRHLPIDGIRTIFNALKHRNDPGRCLHCGGFQYIDIDDTRLRHVGCGGRFEASFWIGGINLMRSTLPVYSTEGMLIGKLSDDVWDDGYGTIEPFGYDDLYRPEILDTYAPGSRS
jgi:hypothetical protein